MHYLIDKECLLTIDINCKITELWHCFFASNVTKKLMFA